MRRKSKESGRNLVGIDAQGRAYLPSSVRVQYGLEGNGRQIHLTLDPINRILGFRAFEDIEDYAARLAQDVAAVKRVDVVEFMFFNHAAVGIDGRGRIALPENLRHQARIDDQAHLIATRDYICLVNAEECVKRHEAVGDRLRKELDYLS